MRLLENLAMILVCYGVATLILYFISDHMIFVPPASTYKDNQHIIKIHTNDDSTISAVYLPNHNAKYTILFSHGNAEDLGMILPTLQALNAMGFAVLGYDYPGYGTSSARPSESGSYASIVAAYNYLINEQAVDPKHIILFGRSLGTGPSVELARNYPVGGVILQAPFVSIYRVVTRFPLFFFDKFRNLSKVNQIDAPILIVHGTNDHVVPFWHGQEIYKASQGNKAAYWAYGAGHNDLDVTTDPEYHARLLAFIQQLPAD